MIRPFMSSAGIKGALIEAGVSVANRWFAGRIKDVLEVLHRPLGFHRHIERLDLFLGSARLGRTAASSSNDTERDTQENQHCELAH